MGQNAKSVMTVEVAYAAPEAQVLKSVEVPRSGLVRDAIRSSGLLDDFPDIDLDVQPVGIFGEICNLETPLKPGDRVEIYRPLLTDPKIQRRKRVKPVKS